MSSARGAVPAAAAALALLLALAGSSCAPRPAGDVILVTLDTTRDDRVGAQPGAASLTPALDALAAEGTRFLDASCQVPITTPSHATILTGLLPPVHGVRDNGTFALPGSALTLAERLRDRGFATHAVIASFALDRRFGLDQGFTGYDDDLGAGPSWPRVERKAAEVIDRAIAWLGTAPAKAFLWVHIYDPHHPYAPPAPWAERFRERPYDGEVAYADAELGRLFAELERRGRWRDALVIVVGDHGEALGEHGERYHGTLLYQATLHVPLLVKWPGRGPRHRVAQPVGTDDIVPTVLAAVGAGADPELPGRDLRPLAGGGTAAERPVYAESLTAELHYGWSALRALRGERFKLIRGARDELYDLAADPAERRDHARADPDAVEELGGVLDRLGAAAGAPGGSRVGDAETAEKIAALGYVSAGGSSAGARAIDPAARIELEGLVIDALEAEAADPARAAALYRQVLAEDPALKIALLHLAGLEEAKGDLAAALALYRQVLERYPDVEVALLGATRLLVRLGDPAAAYVLAERGLATLKRSDGLRLLLAELDRARGERDRARAHAQAVAPEGQDGGRAAYLLALLAGSEGSADEALHQLERAASRGIPANPRSLALEPAFATIRSRPEFLILLESRPSRPR